MANVLVNRGTGLASLNRYFAWGSELRPWPGELDYLNGVTLRLKPYNQPWFRDAQHARAARGESEYTP